MAVWLHLIRPKLRSSLLSPPIGGGFACSAADPGVGRGECGTRLAGLSTTPAKEPDVGCIRLAKKAPVSCPRAPVRAANVREVRAAGVVENGGSRAQLREGRSLLEPISAASGCDKPVGLRPPVPPPEGQPLAAGGEPCRWRSSGAAQT